MGKVPYVIRNNELIVPFINNNGGLGPKEKKEGYETLDMVAESIGLEISAPHFYAAEKRGDKTLYEFCATIKGRKGAR
jgi:hypothetical protein